MAAAAAVRWHLRHDELIGADVEAGDNLGEGAGDVSADVEGVLVAAIIERQLRWLPGDIDRQRGQLVALRPASKSDCAVGALERESAILTS